MTEETQDKAAQEAEAVQETAEQPQAEASPAPEPEKQPAPTPDPRDEEIAKLREENATLLRAVAEMQTIQRRQRDLAEQERKYASESLVREILPVLDNFERGLASLNQGASVEAVTDGLKTVDRQMRKALETVGVERIIALGAKFDPEFHEALFAVEDEKLDEDTVLEELEPGYKMHDRVIRASKVKVSKKP